MRYPQGAEKMLVWALLRRAVPVGGIPLDVGVVVQNVATAAAAAVALAEGRPLTHRIVTVSGRVASPGNWRVPLGTSFVDLVQAAGGLTGALARVIAGGPMMGIAQPDLDVPVIKTTGSVILLGPEDLMRPLRARASAAGAAWRPVRWASCPPSSAARPWPRDWASGGAVPRAGVHGVRQLQLRLPGPPSAGAVHPAGQIELGRTPPCREGIAYGKTESGELLVASSPHLWAGVSTANHAGCPHLPGAGCPRGGLLLRLAERRWSSRSAWAPPR